MTAQLLILVIGIANALALAFALWVMPGNRAANRTLALLILVLSIRVGPHLLGLADFSHDRRSLVFAPLDFTFAIGPLIWLYIAQLTQMPLSRHWRWHFAPTVMQFVYCAVCFLLPFEMKWAWYSGVHLNVIAPVSGTLILALLAIYLTLGWRMTTRYRVGLDDAFAERDETRLFGLRAFLLAFALAIAAGAFATVFMLMAPAHRFDARFPLMLVIVVLTYALGLLGWRNATISFPPSCTLSAPDAPLDPDQPADGYKAQAEIWRQRVQTSDWWCDETLDLAGLAARLGTTPRTLSRVIGEGRGENFRSFIGRIRVDAVCAALEASNSTTSILEIAFASGFSSKASFNRVFLQHRGMTPTTFRALAAAGRLKNSQSTALTDFEAT